jgi:cytochrome c peroxidase
VTTKSGRIALKAVTPLFASALFLLSATQSHAQTLPQLDVEDDPAGRFATYQPNGASSETTAFFQSLGTNGRTCATCHLSTDGFGINLTSIQNIFNATNGTDPLFAAIDGADCLDQPTSHNMLLNHGLFRILLPISPKTESGATPQWTISVVSDPTNCQLSNPNVQAQCATQFGAGFQCISLYRRPLISTDLTFDDTLMWDGREPSPALPGGLTAALSHQAIDATLGHAQATSTPTAEEVSQIVTFESGLYTAQMTDNNAGSLDANGATENPEDLPSLDFFFGINNSSDNPNNPLPPFDPNVFTFFDAWINLTGTDPVSLAQESIARGEDIFNNRTFTGNGSNAGFTTCSGCHNNPSIGNNTNNSVNTPNPGFFVETGVDSPTVTVNALNVSYLPVFAVTCTATGVTFKTTDPGVTLITGKCGPLAATAIPTLHALSAHLPLFHNGAANSMADVVTFYNHRFSMGLSARDQTDLANFLGTL